MSDSVNERTAEFRIVFQGATGSFIVLTTIGKESHEDLTVAAFYASEMISTFLG